MIYHGLAGHLLFGTGPHILRTRIIAPLAFRIAQVQDRLQCNREEAVAYIEKMDEDRRKWTQLLYGVDWEDASLYDVVVNLEQMNIEEACAVKGCLEPLASGRCSFRIDGNWTSEKRPSTYVHRVQTAVI